MSFRSRKIAAPNRTTIYYNWAFKENTHGDNGPERSHSDEIREIWKLFRETDRKFEETAEQIKATQKMVNDLTGKWGKFVEGLVAPGAIRMFRERGVNIERTSQRVIAQKGGENMEIDVLCVNDEDVLAIEVKSTLNVDDVKEHIERLSHFKRFFPEYQEKSVLGAVAGIVFEGGSDKFAYKQGLFVIGQTGETVHILNDEQFKPKAW